MMTGFERYMKSLSGERTADVPRRIDGIRRHGQCSHLNRVQFGNSLGGTGIVVTSTFVAWTRAAIVRLCLCNDATKPTGGVHATDGG